MTLWGDFLRRLMLSASLSGAAAEPPTDPPADPPAAEVGEPSGGGAALAKPAEAVADTRRGPAGPGLTISG